MLIEFRVTNFRSFRDTQVFSMVASADQSLPDNTIETPVMGKQRLLRSAAMYGPNASGKSNLVKAFEFVHEFLTTSTIRKPGGRLRVKPFALNLQHVNSPSEFEITFIHNSVRYQYGFSVDQERIYTEFLVAYPKGVRQVWYERSIDSDTEQTLWYFGPRYRGERQRLTRLTRPDVPFLSVAATFNHPLLSKIYDWFNQALTVIDPTIMGNVLEHVTGLFSSHDEYVKNIVKQMMQYADLGISNVSYDERSWKEEDFDFDVPEEVRSIIMQNPRIEIIMHHEAEEGDSTVAFPLEEESLGTRRFFGFIGYWLPTLMTGGVFVVDELDASLHPTLVRTLVQMFHDPKINTKGAQLIFNTHDVTLLDTGLFRRDQFWFVEKDRSGASHIYSLLEYSPRPDEALQRGYLRGRYGAIPSTSELLNLDVTRG